MKRYLIVLLILSVSLTIMARSPLTFEERVKAQEAIERVYYNHRIWPKENPQPKPSFEKMVPKEVIEAKVTDYLKKCSALDQFWQRPIVASQLQAEMDRMAKGSKDPATLNELFVALNNDPYLIAECLARPVLADRLIHNWYANDERFHKEAREQAEKALQHLTPENFCGYSEGQYSKMTYRLETENREEMNESDPDDNSIKIDENEFASILAELPEKGKISAIQENNDSFMIVHTTAKNGSGIEVESLSFQKTGVDEWLKSQNDEAILPQTSTTSESMHLPPMPESACTEGWDNGVLEVPYKRRGHTAVWTGSEMIIWGGYYGGGGVMFNTGGRYNPSTDTWKATSLETNCPSIRDGHTAVWTGHEMIIWGGRDGSGKLITGGKYNPSTDTWTVTSTGDNCPSGREGFRTVWTGNEMIVWGGYGSSYLNSGGRYNPQTDAWTATSTGTNCPTPRGYHTAIWANNEMIVWGGYDGSSCLNSGGRYNPVSDTWVVTSTINCPASRYGPPAVWTNSEMIIWGGYGSSPTYKNDGGRYNPLTDMWTATSTGTNCPSARRSNTVIWTGAEMIVWGGQGDSPTYKNDGGRYNPAKDSWTTTSTGSNCPAARAFHTAVWTGTEMIIWGGADEYGEGSLMHTGGRYNPSDDSWVPTCPGPTTPSERSSHTALWTGAEMIVWGGYNGSSYLNTGGKYDLITDTWQIISTGTYCPSGRSEHSASWTGTEMIVWGGRVASSTYANTGGRYNPSTDTWDATSVDTNCPSARGGHTAVWSGTEMIIWGGGYNTGGKYNPSSDSWIHTSTETNCPSARYGHTAVWSGTEMIVWGGYFGYPNYLNTGGRYNPATDSWSPTSIGMDCPSARDGHSAVWTGSEMIIWGGEQNLQDPYYSYKTGGRYNPLTDGWTATSVGTDCPSKRSNHSAVWTGTEMIVWGGKYYTTCCMPDTLGLQTGGRYNPASNTWIPTLTGPDCPNSRGSHRAVWTGNEMIVWGGWASDNWVAGYLQTGGIYYVPYAPSGLSNNSAADIDGCNDSGVFIGWSIPSNWGDGGSGTRTFDVFRDSTPIATGLGESTHSHTDTAGNNGASYVYSVRANSGCGLSTTTAGASASDNVAANPAGLSNNTTADNGGCADNGVSISWSIPSTWGDGSSGTRTYDVLRDGTSIATGLSESTLSYTDTTGDNGVSYLYQVRANNSCGLSTTTTGVSAADNIGATPDEVLNFDNVYSWDAVSGADGYRLYRGTSADLPNLKTTTADGCMRYEGTATSYDLSGDDPSEATGGLYWYLVTAYTGVCEGMAGEGTEFIRNLSSSTTCP